MTHAIPLPTNDFRDHLLPRVQKPGLGPSVPLVRDVVELGLYVLDGESHRPVVEADLDRWERTIADLMPYAMANLRATSRSSSWMQVKESPGVSFYASEDGLATSRLALMSELLRPWPMEGVLVAIPTDDLLLAVPLHEFDDLYQFELLTLATFYATEQASNGITDQILWFDGENWEHVRVVHDGENTRLCPPKRLLDAIERLTSMQWVKTTAEA